ncbi:cytoglobin-1-like isoform X3 [Physella acuta]|uniref:cytoglobin-1-like isoform X3 n=1 Tax=Physella acuta TaxID=109671 RepID=UPI0027DD36D5|nr:cytoglobin-1-like isoform X3 [Physella acuta]
MDDEEAIFNNNRNTPVFVMPEDQVDVIDKAPTPLTEDQGKILRETWALIKNDVTEVGVETFMGLFHTHPDAIDSFLAFKDKSVQDLERSAVLKAHALRVMQTVDKCITRLDRVDRMVTLLHQLGKRHVGYHANIRLIPIIGKQFISAIEPKIAKKWSSETQAAWECLFSIINYNIRRGLMEEKNRRIEEAKEMEMLLKRSEARSKRDKK